MESSIELLDIAKLALSVLAVVVPALWQLSTKISKLEGSISELNQKLEGVEKEFELVHKELVELHGYYEKLDGIDRTGRKELWQETNAVRERLTVVETKLAKNGK
tara:strand:- start:2178 stop:2492 length:315 start_codon:yes stop_codon:yes gene_type:complete